jgi:hypothetical protein
VAPGLYPCYLQFRDPTDGEPLRWYFDMVVGEGE